MCCLPLQVARDAAAMFCGKVNRLLISADPELHSSLCSSLTPPPMEEGPASPTQDQFVRALRDVLHPLMAQFFVGTVPLSVACVLMDQHILSIILPAYDPLPFCVAGLLLLSRRELLRCRNVSAALTVTSGGLALWACFLVWCHLCVSCPDGPGEVCTE